jgi:hypothetical protein
MHYLLSENFKHERHDLKGRIVVVFVVFRNAIQKIYREKGKVVPLLNQAIYN